MQMVNSIFSNFHGQILVGFSGGADSTALLLLAARGAEESGCELLAVHFNHHLRGEESDKEALEAEEFARKLNVKFLKIDLDIPSGGNLESRARQARLEKWKELCRNYSDPVVLLGHHKDDFIENFFIRIGRGSNASGLTGMQMYSEVDGVKFFRPLIVYTRNEIEDFLRENGINKWAVDSSNINGDFCRNILRNRILPEFFKLFPGGKKAVMTTLDNLSEDAAFIDGMAKDLYENAPDERRSVYFWYLHREKALLCRMLRMLCREFFGDDTPLNMAAVNRFAEMVEDNKSGICVLDEKRSLCFSGGEIFPYVPAPENVLWNWKASSVIHWGSWEFSVEITDAVPENISLYQAAFDMDSLPETLEIGAPCEGEKMLPFGKNREVKVKELRIKRQIPAYPAVPVVRDADKKVLWLPSVRHSGCFTARPKCAVALFSAKNSKNFS